MNKDTVLQGANLYISGQNPPRHGPLSRYLPPLAEGMVAPWLNRNAPAGSWILDPFGSSPRLAVEAAQAGYRVLVAANNPVSRFLMEMSAHPPAEAALHAALADLAVAHRGEERIEPHIQSVYLTECNQCNRPVMAEYFLWERGAPGPYARFYRCPYCHDSGERPATKGDSERAAHFSSGGLHRARALERVVSITDPDRPHVEEALQVYLPRAVYVLFTLINKLDGLSLTPEQRVFLQALILAAADQANTLWPHPTTRERPRQLTIPPRFRENNIWLALEQSIEAWSFPSEPVQCVPWPSQPEKQGISLFEGRLKDWIGSSPDIQIAAVVAALPRSNQAFWTLSALWAGWLWGKEAVTPFKSVLRRRRYDWGWHTTALSANLASLSDILDPGIPFWGLIGEVEPGFISSALIAADLAGFDLEGLAARFESNQAQISWRRSAQISDQHVSAGTARRTAIEGAARYLQQRGQPASYLQVFTAAMASLAQNHVLQVLTQNESHTTEGEPESKPSQYFSAVQAVIKDAFSFRYGFLRYEGSEQSLDVGQWWLRDETGIAKSIADQVEIALVKYLLKHPGCHMTDIDRSLCQLFPGLLTPDLEYIHVCLESYGESDPQERDIWNLRSTDRPLARRTDLDRMREIARNLGQKLNYTTLETTDVQADKVTADSPANYAFHWVDQDGNARYIYYILASAAIGEVVFGSKTWQPPGVKYIENIRRIIILPGSRSNLVAYKLQHDPHLKQEVEKSWILLKYRHLHRLFDNPLLSANNLDDMLSLDPLTYSAPQIRLL
ncbi:MAG: hypothetical protein ACM3PY_03555 [Omnitrophica WOR_2 bacterium]